MNSIGQSWKTLSSVVGFEGRRLTVRVDDVLRPDGTRDTYESIDKPDFAVIIPRTSDGRYYMVEQYRYPVRARSWEFPQGGCENSSSLRACAERELKEELGLVAGDWCSIGKLWLAVGNSNQGFEVFLAQDLQVGDQMLEESEADLIWRIYSEAEISDLISTGVLRSSVTIAAFYLACSLNR